MRKTNAIKRTREILVVVFEYFVLYRFNSHRHESLPVRMRRACEDLGLVFIKLGQLLSTRYDLLPKSYCEELQKLLDDVTSFEFDVVKNTIENDFKKSLPELYVEFDPIPVASASIAQVYKATTHAGNIVAVKIRRPHVDRAIASDMKIFRILALIAQIFSGNLRHINLRHILKQLEEWLHAEVDFFNEANNIQNMQDYYQRLAHQESGEYAQAIEFPHVYNELSSQNVLVMSFIEGIPVRKWRDVENNPEYDVEASLKASLVATMRAWMNEEHSLVFHGDPHPSNMLLLPNGRIALLDFGLVGYFDKKNITETRELFLAVYAKDLEKSIEAALALCNAPKEKYAKRIREDMKQYLKKTRTQSLGFWFFEILRMFVKHRIPMSYDLTAFGRSQAIIDGVFQSVMPDTPTVDILGDELKRALRKKIFDNLQSIDIAPIAYTLSEKAKQSPEKVTDFINRYFDDPFQFLRDVREAVK